jgi:hypothetical protein
VVSPSVKKTALPGRRLLDRNLPWLSERSSTIALATLASLLRAPEAKMMLLGPLLMGVIFGSLLLSGSLDPPVFVRPLLAFAGMAMGLLTLIQVAGNQFGFDRNGFRVFILCPAPRREILLGKNVAFATLPILWGVIVLGFLQWVYHLRPDHLLATIPQFVSMYLLFCLMANWLSILAPIRIAPGSFQPSNTRLIPVLMHLGFLFLFPVVLSPTLLPLGLEFALEQLGWTSGIPICLPLSVLICVAVGFLYRLVLGWQGQVLQAREQTILQLVTTKDT